jgi:hypothetical protein
MLFIEFTSQAKKVLQNVKSLRRERSLNSPTGSEIILKLPAQVLFRLV